MIMSDKEINDKFDQLVAGQRYKFDNLSDLNDVVNQSLNLRDNKWSDKEFELFERERCKAVKESRDSCEYAGLKGVSKDFLNKPLLATIKTMKE
jgi:hypothetical protein